MYGDYDPEDFMEEEFAENYDIRKFLDNFSPQIKGKTSKSNINDGVDNFDPAQLIGPNLKNSIAKGDNLALKFSFGDQL